MDQPSGRKEYEAALAVIAQIELVLKQERGLIDPRVQSHYLTNVQVLIRNLFSDMPLQEREAISQFDAARMGFRLGAHIQEEATSQNDLASPGGAQR